MRAISLCSSSKQHYRFAMYCISVMVNCCSLHSLIRCAEACKLVFSSKFEDEQVLSAYDKLQTWFGELEQLPLCEHDMEETISEDELDDAEEDTIVQANEEQQLSSTTWKPFGALFKLKLDKVQVDDSTTAGHSLNPLYKPELIAKFLKNWFPTAPFWSSMLRGSCMYLSCFAISYKW